jgi:hemolysin III
VSGEPVGEAETSLTRGEEIANSVSHGVGVLLAAAAIPVLVVSAVRRGDPSGVVGGAIFGATIALLYVASTLYHAVPYVRAKRVLRIIDHSAIYLLIAGTYTPFALGVLRGPWGWSLFGVMWGLAVLGVAAKITLGPRFPKISTAVYLIMGWLVMVAIRPLVHAVPPMGLALIAAGGLAYTGGVGFYAARRVRYAHFVWHLFVLAGTTCHFFAVLWYAA